MAALTKLTTNINLEMSGDTKRYLVSAKQGDKATRFIVARLLNNGEPYTIPTGARAVINITKPDGKHVYNTCSYSGSDVTVELTNQALAASGTAYCDIEIRTSDDSQVITSASFTMEIEPSQRNENAILSANEFTDLENRIAGHIKNIDDTDAAVKKAESARVVAENARVKAEQARVTAENKRQENENTRIQQEQQRQQDTSQAVETAYERLPIEMKLAYDIFARYLVGCCWTKSTAVNPAQCRNCMNMPQCWRIRTSKPAKSSAAETDPPYLSKT